VTPASLIGLSVVFLTILQLNWGEDLPRTFLAKGLLPKSQNPGGRQKAD
jgi:hypothetical protein